jgi:hypothetical protein
MLFSEVYIKAPGTGNEKNTDIGFKNNLENGNILIIDNLNYRYQLFNGQSITH